MRRGKAVSVAAGIGALLLAVVVVLASNNAQRANELRERLRVVTTVSALAMHCPDDRTPFQVTIRNLASRTAIAATILLNEDPTPVGTFDSEIPRVTLKAPLAPGSVVTECYALNRYRLIARGVDPRSVRFSPRPIEVVFE